MAVLKYKDENDNYLSLIGYNIFENDVVQTTGDSETSVMSQKAVTDELGSLDEKIPAIQYNTSTKKLTKTIDGVTTDIVTAANIVSDGGVKPMTGATALSAGLSGLVPAPAAGLENSYLKGNGTWSGIDNYSMLTEDLQFTKITGLSKIKTSYVSYTSGSTTYNRYSTIFLLGMDWKEACKIVYFKLSVPRNVPIYLINSSNYSATTLYTANTFIFQSNIPYIVTSGRPSNDYSDKNGTAILPYGLSLSYTTNTYLIHPTSGTINSKSGLSAFANALYISFPSGYNYAGGTPSVTTPIPNNTTVTYEIIKTV